jgi:hypothetical protein
VVRRRLWDWQALALQKRINSECAKLRNERSKLEIGRDFKRSIMQLKQRAKRRAKCKRDSAASLPLG